MLYASAADAVVVVHLLFILFVVLGGFVTWIWWRVAWVHIPAAVYGVLIELIGWTCPLTPLENWLRRRAGESGYEGGFIEHALTPIIYPEDYGPDLAIALAMIVLLSNITSYYGLLRLRRRMTRSS